MLKIFKESTITDWLLAIFSGALTFLTIFQFFIIKGQLDVMRKDERPWLVPDNDPATPKLTANAPLTAKITITNTGKTPAYKIRGIFNIAVVPNGESPAFIGFDTGLTTGIIYPNDRRGLSVTRQEPKKGQPSGVGEPIVLTADEKRSLETGKSWLAVFGALTYVDTFQTSHWIHICSWFPYYESYTGLKVVLSTTAQTTTRRPP